MAGMVRGAPALSRAWAQMPADVGRAAKWLPPYVGAAMLSAPAFALGLPKHGIPFARKGYEEGGVLGALGGLTEAARKVPVIGEPSVDIMEAATEYAESQGASAPAMFLADVLAPDPTGKIGALASGAAALAKGMGGLNLAVIPAFVGSPHRWSMNPDLGRLGTRMDKIGTGEGAQAFLQGNYSATARDLAENYAQTGARNSRFDPGGKRYRIVEGISEDGKWMIDSIWDRPHAAGIHEPQKSFLRDGSSGSDLEFDSREEALSYLKERGLVDSKSEMTLTDPDFPELSDGVVDSRAAHVYGVLHDVEPEQLLDLDKRPSQQAPEVRAALAKLGLGTGGDVDFDVDYVADELELLADNDYALYQQREQVQKAIDAYKADPTNSGKRKRINRLFADYNLLSDEGSTYLDMAEDTPNMTSGDNARDLESKLGGPDATVRALREAGIPGAMYYDGFSREAGEGTRNYVMFSDDLTYVDPSRTDPDLIGDMPVGAPWRTVDSPPQVSSAVVRVVTEDGEEIAFRGGWHGEAYEEAKRVLGDDLEMAQVEDGLFELTDGTIIDSREAMERFPGVSTGAPPPPNYSSAAPPRLSISTEEFDIAGHPVRSVGSPERIAAPQAAPLVIDPAAAAARADEIEKEMRKIQRSLDGFQRRGTYWTSPKAEARRQEADALRKEMRELLQMQSPEEAARADQAAAEMVDEVLPAFQGEFAGPDASHLLRYPEESYGITPEEAQRDILSELSVFAEEVDARTVEELVDKLDSMLDWDTTFEGRTKFSAEAWHQVLEHIRRVGGELGADAPISQIEGLAGASEGIGALSSSKKLGALAGSR